MAYGVALYAVGRPTHVQARAASVIATLEIVLGCGMLLEVARRFVFGSAPESTLMVGVGAVALAANVW
jgi:Co/Zn/Cd efflux system component